MFHFDFQFIINFILLFAEFGGLCLAAALVLIGWERCQEGWRLRAPLKIRAIRKEVKKGSSK